VIETGWTKRWRKRWKYGLESTEQGRFTLLIMDFLIDHAAFAPTKEWIKRVGVVKYERGEAIVTISMLADRFKVDPQRIRTSLSQLEKMEFLNTQTNNRFTKIIITNYSTYQDAECEPNTLANKQTTSRQQADNTPLIDKKLRSKERITGDVAAPPPLASILGIQKTKTPKLIPDDLALTPQMIDHATGLGIENVQRVFESFKAHHANKGTKGLSWGQGWITWCSNETKFKGGNGGGAPRKTYAQMQQEENERNKQAFLKECQEKGL
jgi:hypothetical protein